MGLFTKNKLDLKLEKFSFKSGEIIKGSFTIDLKKTYHARKIQVSLIGRRKEEERDHDGEYHTYYNTLYDFAIPLAQEGDYQYQQFHFELKAPNNVSSYAGKRTYKQLDGALGKLQEIGKAFSGHSVYPVEWLVEAHIDIPARFDMKKSQDIIISD